MRSILPFDEINQLVTDIRSRFKDKKLSDDPALMEDILDEMLDIFLLTYATANRVTGESLDYEYEPTTDEVMATVNKVVAGETWEERVEDCFSTSDSADDTAQGGTSRPTSTERVVRGGTSVPTTAKGETPEQRKPRDGGVEDLIRIIETESHRIANETALNTAGRAGATKKKWVTMLDDRVRDTHAYLEGQSVPYDADFYTFDGDHAKAPGLFALPENNINCRCELTFEK